MAFTPEQKAKILEAARLRREAEDRADAQMRAEQQRLREESRSDVPSLGSNDIPKQPSFLDRMSEATRQADLRSQEMASRKANPESWAKMDASNSLAPTVSNSVANTSSSISPMPASVTTPQVQNSVSQTPTDPVATPTPVTSSEPVAQPQSQPSTKPMNSSNPFDLAQQGVQDEAQATMEYNTKVADSQIALEEQRQLDIESEKARILKQEAAFNEEAAKFNEEAEVISNTKIDNGRFWKNASTGSKIGLGLSLFLGVLGSRNTGENAAVKIIDAAIKNDINAQLADLDTKQQGLKDKRGILQDNYNRTKDVNMALAMTNQQSYNSLLKDLEARALKEKNPIIQAQIKKGVAQVLQEKNEWDLKVKQMQEDSFFKRITAQASLAKAQNVNNDLVTPFGAANSREDAKVVKAGYEAKQSFDNKIQQMIELREKYGAEKANQEAVARGQQLSKDALLAYKNMAKLGVLSQSDEKIINAIIPANPLAFEFVSLAGQDTILPRLKAFQKDADLDFNTMIKTRIATPNGNVPASRESAKYSATQEKAIDYVAKKNGISRDEAINALKSSGKL